MTDQHKNNPGDYSVTCYCPVGRRRGIRLRARVTDAQALADRWARLTRGSATVHRCIYNTAISRGKWR